MINQILKNLSKVSQKWCKIMKNKTKILFVLTFSILILGLVTPILNTMIANETNYKTYQDPEDPITKISAVEQYDMTVFPYAEYDAYTYGTPLGLFGDDVTGMYDLPFNFTFYDVNYTRIYIGSNGWLSFTETDLSAYICPGFPTPTYTNVIAPLWEDLVAEDNIFILATPDWVVIEYHDYYYLGGALAGTFSVFLAKTGEIIFLYEDVFQSDYAWIGLNYGYDTFYYNQYIENISSKTLFAILFTTGTWDYHDLMVDLYCEPNYILGDSAYVDAEVTNIGTYTETDIDFYLYLDGAIVDSLTIPSLLPGQSQFLTFDVSGLGEGYYNFTAYAVPVTGEATAVNNLVEKWCSVLDILSMSFIVVNVYDDVTMDPIPFVDIYMFDDMYNLLDSVQTDYGGFYNFTGLVVGIYHLDFLAMDYQSASYTITVTTDGEAHYLNALLQPIPDRTLTILTPTEGQTVSGGSVLVTFTADDTYDLSIIDIYVNSLYVTTIHYDQFYMINETFVPVFQNGTNLIEFFAYWGEGSESYDSVTINSIDVLPIFPVKPGDIYYLKATLLTSPEYMNYNFTFSNWISPFVINVTGHYKLYNDTHVLGEFYDWIAVNILNGYVPFDSGSMMGWQYQRFFAFSYFDCLATTGTLPSIGDKTTYGTWNDIFTITGSDYWNGVEIWVLEDVEGCVMYAEKSTQIITHFLYPAYVYMQMVYTSLDITDPIINSPADIVYILGDTGNVITWNANDLNPLTYTLYVDDVEITTDIWMSGIDIIIGVDGLSVGTYEYKIVVSDAGGNTVEDIVTVTVDPAVPELTYLYFAIFFSSLILVSYITKKLKKKFDR